MANLIVPPAIPTLTVGGRVFTDLNNLLIVTGYCLGTTNVNTSMRKAGGSSGYQVPASKSFRILAAQIECGQTTAGSNILGYVLYADNDVGVNSSSAFTNPIYMGGTQLAGVLGTGASLAGVQQYTVNIDFSVPTGKYPAFFNGSTATNNTTVRYFGYEV